MSITAIVENGSVKLPAQVPDGTRVEIHLSGQRGELPPEMPGLEALQVFRRLQQEIGLTAESAVAWKNQVADARR